MNTTGIIAEYNPFHNGHLYQLNQARKESKADYIVIVMSGDFVQRGTPAVIDKYTRTRMALSNGADLVLELPVLWSTASAEYFASAGVTMLNNLGVTDSISFGVESDTLEQLSQIAAVLQEEPDCYKLRLSEALKQGDTFPVARKKALLSPGILPKTADFKQIGAILDTPNNILGIEYLKALQKRRSPIAPAPVLRRGSGYHDTDLNALASASAIRLHMHQNGSSDELKAAMPDSALTLLQTYIRQFPLLNEDNFSSILKYKLLLESDRGYSDYADCNPDLSNRILNGLNEYRSYSDFCDLLKSKEVTHTRISRLLLHIMLHIKNSDYLLGRESDYIPYLRVLGFRRDAAPLLSEIKKHAAVPLITKMADAKKILAADSWALRMLSMDIFAADVYNSVRTDITGRSAANEYTQGIVLL